MRFQSYFAKTNPLKILPSDTEHLTQQKFREGIILAQYNFIKLGEFR